MSDPRNREHADWIWGWDPTPGIVSVWAEPDGRAHVWRRDPESRTLAHERTRYRPWLLLDSLADIMHLGDALVREPREPREPRENPDTPSTAPFSYCELEGAGALRYLVSAAHGGALTQAVLDGASRRHGTRMISLRARDEADGGETSLALPPEEQYLVASGRVYFRDLPFDALRRLQFDLETTGLDAERSRVFMIAVREPDGRAYTLDADDESSEAEARLIARLVDVVRDVDPDVIENHNLHGFDLPFIERRARATGARLTLGRLPGHALVQRAAMRGAPADYDASRRIRFAAPGRELIDTLDATRKYDFATRELPGYGLKAVARHLGIAGPTREYIRGDRIYATYRTDPERVRRYAIDDVDEVEALSRMIGGAAFALARMVPRRYERLSDAGPATGMIDPLMTRAYVRSRTALPAHREGDGTVHTGAALHLFATGVARRVVKADVASLYPSLIRTHRIGPARDTLGAFVALVDELTEQRLAAKHAAAALPKGSGARHAYEAVSSAMKMVINSAYGYLGAGGDLVRFADVHAANEVTRRGRATLDLMCRELDRRGVTLLEADTDGVYFAVPAEWTEEDERRVVQETGALLPPLVRLEFEGRYAAMLSHEPKNYALLGYDGTLVLRGVAFRSSRAEPYGDAFLREAIRALLAGDMEGVRRAYVEAVSAVRRRALPTYDVSSKVRLTKTPAQYRETRESRREFAYEALLVTGRTKWSIGERVRVYRTVAGGGAVVEEREEGETAGAAGTPSDPRDYDTEHYSRQLRDAYATRLARAFAPSDFETLFADPIQESLFQRAYGAIRPVLTRLSSPSGLQPPVGLDSY